MWRICLVTIMISTQTDIWIFFSGGALFAAFFYLLIIVSEMTPSATVERPILGIYIYLNMMLVVVAMGISTIVIWLYEQEDKSKRSYIVDKVGIECYIHKKALGGRDKIEITIISVWERIFFLIWVLLTQIFSNFDLLTRFG